MEGRVSRGRSWRRGGGRGNDSEGGGGGGDRRGRGGRGRGKRDHYRGRGRGGGAPAAGFHHWGQDEGEELQPDEEDGMEVFSRRKLESNWDRYEESERAELVEDLPTQRGTDYHVLLESAGDSFTQFRFAEEKDWEMDSSAANQMSAVFVDLPALAQCLQEVPLHQRLNLEAELLQVSTPVELPTMTVAPKQDTAKIKVVFPPQRSALKDPLLGPPTQASSSSAQPALEEVDEELDQLLTLQKAAERSVSITQEESVFSWSQSVTPNCVPGAAELEVSAEPGAAEKVVPEVEEVGSSQAALVRPDMTEEDLEDWLDSMIS